MLAFLAIVIQLCVCSYSFTFYYCNVQLLFIQPIDNQNVHRSAYMHVFVLSYQQIAMLLAAHSKW